MTSKMRSLTVPVSFSSLLLPTCASLAGLPFWLWVFCGAGDALCFGAGASGLSWAKLLVAADPNVKNNNRGRVFRSMVGGPLNRSLLTDRPGRPKRPFVNANEQAFVLRLRCPALGNGNTNSAAVG